MATAWRSLVAEVTRKKSERPESAGSSSRMRVSSPFLSSQAAAAAWTRMRVCLWLWCVTIRVLRSPRFIVEQETGIREQGTESRVAGWLSVEVVIADVFRDGSGDQRSGGVCGGASFDLLPNVGGADFDVEAGKYV